MVAWLLRPVSHTLWILRMEQSLEAAERAARRRYEAMMEEYGLHSEGPEPRRIPGRKAASSFQRAG